MMYCAPRRKPSPGSVRFRASCIIHGPSASDVIPAISTLRVFNVMTKNTTYRTRPLSVSTSTVKKSAAAMPSQCAARKVFHDVFAPRSGAGSMPWSLRIALIVLRATSWPTPFSPPRIRVYPQVGSSVAMRTTSAAISGLVLGRPKPSRLRAVVFLGDKAAIPPQDGVRCHDAGDGCKTAPAEDFAFHRQAAALVVGETQTSGSVRSAEHPILL